MTTTELIAVPFAQVDPFTQVHDAIWSHLERHHPFAELVRRGNRIRLTSDGDPTKHARLDADSPQAAISESGGTISLFHTSTSCRMTMTYTLELETASRDMTRLNRVLWEAARALSRTDDTLGLPFVVEVRVAAAPIDLSDNAGKMGWTALMGLTVTMMFNRQQDMESD